ncbi:MAG: hypothetical protein ACKO96_28145 [Flammeovirgaceae bacterium]
MYVPEIITVKDHLAQLKKDGLIADWELPYENILTRRSAAIFFVTPKDENSLQTLSQQLAAYENFSYRDNTEKKLSQLQLRVTFSQEEKTKNEAAAVSK